MERRPTSILTTLALSMLVLTLIAPWALGQDPALITEIRRQAEQGDVDAKYNLGVAYALGVRIKDAAESVRWFLLAAEQGHAGAQYQLGFMYREGRRGVREDDAEAARWFQLAAEQGHALAQFNLGFMYGNGRGVLKDEAEAVRWYRVAAEQRNATAQTPPRAHVLPGAGRAQGFRDRTHVVQRRWRKRKRKRQGIAGQP